jgi:hypothetical protein
VSPFLLRTTVFSVGGGVYRLLHSWHDAYFSIGILIITTVDLGLIEQ